MLLKATSCAPVLIIRPGSTEFDDQGRIKGSLDMPMSLQGHEQVEALIEEVRDFNPQVIYVGPCESARQTADRLAEVCDAKVKVVETLQNVDHGLWHGKLIDELKRNSPKLYKQGQESPSDVCPPSGESCRDAAQRVEKAVRKIVKKSGRDLVAIIVPDPLGQIIQSMLSGVPIADLWSAETDAGQWKLIEPDVL